MIRCIVCSALFLASAAWVAHRRGWWPAVSRHPGRALLLAGMAMVACWVGGTKPPVEPPEEPEPPEIVIRCWLDDDGRIILIDYPVEVHP